MDRIDPQGRPLPELPDPGDDNHALRPSGRAGRGDGVGNGTGAGGSSGGGGGGGGSPVSSRPPSGYRQAPSTRSSTLSQLRSGRTNSGTQPPTGSTADSIYMLDVTPPWTDDDKKRFFDCLAQTMNMQQQLYKHCEEIMKKLMNNASLIRLG